MKIACMIPARLQSSRFPKKMLASIDGKPLLQWVWEAAFATNRFDEVVIAVDAEETADLVRSFGGGCAMTSPDCLNGTERAIELLKSGLLDADIIVNWQGDEPFIHTAMIDDLLQSIEKEKSDLWTLKKKITDLRQVASPLFAKVVTDHQNHALLFSRSPVPCYRDICPDDEKIYYKHIGIYAFTKEALLKIGEFPPCPIEIAEQLEQLRFLYHGLKIKVHETIYEAQGIDIPEHLALAEELIKGKKPSIVVI